MKFTYESIMKIISLPNMLLAAAFIAGAAPTRADPQITSWFTTYSGQYARIYTTDANRTNGLSLTAWTNSTVQALPAYCGVQEIYSSSNWVYLRSTGLGSYVMGAWYLNAGHSQLFPTWPVNQKTLYHIPRTPTVTTNKTANGGGPIGYFVDGVAMFNSWDAYTYSTVSNVDAQNITGYWNRDAFVNEGVTFDPNNAHQANGQYHYHANVPALRHQLGDHIDFNTSTKIYTEQTGAPTQHSPILAWTADGFPLYGPYGYSNALDPNSGLKRMVSGYTLRNGLKGTDNLTNTLRTNLPAWSSRLFGTNFGNNFAGPANLTTFPLGRYMEDNAYLGDLTNSLTGSNYVQGVDFDLNEYNCRYCVTPEFPGGTYAYFVSISSNGAPVFPYNIGRGFYGSPVGGTISYIPVTENVATNFLGGTNLDSTMNPPAVGSGTVTLTWSAVEGGAYRVDATTNFAGWTPLATNLSPNQILGSYTNSGNSDFTFYRNARNGVAGFDPAGTTIFATNSYAPGGSAGRGGSVAITITLPGTPLNPPVNAMLSTITLGTNSGFGLTHPLTNSVSAIFTLAPNGASGPQNLVVVFAPPPGQPQGANYTLTNGFTIY